MKIIEYYSCGDQGSYLSQIKQSDWGAGQYLYELLRDGSLKALCGESTQVLMLTEGGKLMAFCTLADKDDIQPTELSPWIGFVYTFPKYRGKRLAGYLLSYAEEVARSEDREFVYISTDHVGLYEKYGMHLNTQSSFTCEGASGMERMREIMEDLRKNAPDEICGKKVLWMSDYQASVKKSAAGQQPIHLPHSNVVEYGLEGDNVIVVRPSGTEPKIKVYFMVKGQSRAEAEDLEAQLKVQMTRLMGF